MQEIAQHFGECIPLYAKGYTRTRHKIGKDLKLLFKCFVCHSSFVVFTFNVINMPENTTKQQSTTLFMSVSQCQLNAIRALLEQKLLENY